VPVERVGGGVRVPLAALADLDAAALAMVWPVILARAGVRADRRGAARLAEFTGTARRGRRIPVSGGWEIARTRDAFEVRPAGEPSEPRTALLADGTAWDAWTFRRVRPARPAGDPWTAALPADRPLVVRRWQPGDRLRYDAAQPPRRVKRFLAEAGISGALRRRWPVVLADGDVVWIPGVRRGLAIASGAGGTTLTVRCELHDG
jgi:tRNA(Ile)-lysidine synthase